MGEAIVARELPLRGAYGLEVKQSQRLWSLFHEAYCVTVVSAGHGRWRYRRREASIAPQSLMLMDPGEVHVTTSVDVPGDFHALFFAPELVREIVEATTSREPHFRVLSTAQPALVAQFGRACALLQRGGEREAQLEEFSLAVARLFDHSGEAPPVPHLLPTTRVRKAARLLRERYESAPGHTVNVAEVALLVGMNYHWLVHSFTDEFGMPPYQYVQALRLAKTRSLLLQGPRDGLRSLADIAKAVGFCDKSHLHRTVKRQYGVSPWQLGLELNPSWGTVPSR
jgi:AraC-like DNA-binding protein